MKNAKDLYAQLLTLHGQAGTSLFKRLNLAKQLLADKAWVESLEGGGGHEGEAIDRLEDNCFGDLCGSMSLPQMLEVLEAIPSETTWKAAKYNLRSMWTEMKARQLPAKKQEKRERPDMDAKDRKIAIMGERIVEMEEELKLLRCENRKLKTLFANMEKQFHARVNEVA